MYQFEPNRNPRATTRRVQDLVDQGALSAETAWEACLRYMSERDVADMAEQEGFIDPENAE